VDSLADVDSVVEFLRSSFPEYARKQLPIFRQHVQRAIRIVKNNGMRNETDSEEEEDRQEDQKHEGHNLLNSTLRTSYQPPAEGTNVNQETTAASASGSSSAPASASAVASAAASSDKSSKPKQSKKAQKRSMQEGDMAEGSGETLGTAERPTARYADLGGMESALQDVRELIEYPLTHPEIYAHLGVEPPRGILLHGPPGCGKTLLANAIAGELGVPFFKVSAPEIVSGMSGESEAKVRTLFSDAVKAAPCIVFIDEIDAITPKRETAQREMERRIVAQLLTCMDGLSMDATSGKPVLVIGATNRPDSLDPALRRAGRFDREISLGIPDEAARARILRVMCDRLRLAGDFDFDEIARRTPGFVGADLNALTKEAAVIAVNRIFHELFDNGSFHDASAEGSSSNIVSADVHGEALASRARVSDALRLHTDPLSDEQLAGLNITMGDFNAAVGKVQPSSKREGFATIPDVTWEDIGALHDVRQELQMAIMEPIRHPQRFAALGLSAPAGVLLYGPPGCGKTLLAKAIASESGASFISIKGPELLNKFVGESERAVRQVFARGRASAPCVIFFDELDALCPRRGADSQSSQSSERVVNQLLTEMDGLESRKAVFVIAATNRPDIIDPAMLRPGRLDKLLYVPLPRPPEREAILRTLTRKTPLADDIVLSKLAEDARLEGFSGADLAGLVREAAVAALRESLHNMTEDVRVAARHFDMAFNVSFPSVSKRDEKVYNALRGKLRRVRANVQADEAAAGKDAVGGADAGRGAQDGEGDGDALMA
jgi:ribosome biogenesis ATPase